MFSRSLTMPALFCCLMGSSILAEAPHGSFAGQFVLDGIVPEPVFLIRQGDQTVKDAAICAGKDLADESLIVDPKTKGIANLFVFLHPAEAKRISVPDSLAKSQEKEVRLDVKNCRFTPHVLIIRTDQALRVRMLDSIVHNPHFYTVDNETIGSLIPPRDPQGIVRRFDVAERLPMPVKCDVHPHMMAHLLIVDHPYAAVTDSEGRFHINGLPAGEHTFRVWHEGCGYVIKDWKVTIRLSEMTAMEPVKVPKEKLTKPE